MNSKKPHSRVTLLSCSVWCFFLIPLSHWYEFFWRCKIHYSTAFFLFFKIEHNDSLNHSILLNYYTNIHVYIISIYKSSVFNNLTFNVSWAFFFSFYFILFLFGVPKFVVYAAHPELHEIHALHNTHNQAHPNVKTIVAGIVCNHNYYFLWVPYSDHWHTVFTAKKKSLGNEMRSYLEGRFLDHVVLFNLIRNW